EVAAPKPTDHIMHRAADGCSTRVRMEVGRVTVVDRLHQAKIAERTRVGRSQGHARQQRPSGQCSKCAHVELYSLPRSFIRRRTKTFIRRMYLEGGRQPKKKRKS